MASGSRLARAYFVTIVAHDRNCLFGEIKNDEMKISEMGRIANICWRAIPEHFPNVELGTFIVMPNHIQGIIILHERADAVASAQKGTIYRAPTTVNDGPTGADRTHTGVDNSHAERFQKPVPGSIPTIIRTYKAAVTREIIKRLGEETSIWQRNYYDHIIRTDDEHNLIHFYIESNVHNWTMDEENPIYADDSI